MKDYTTLSDEELTAERIDVDQRSEQVRLEKLAIKKEVLRREARDSVDTLLTTLTAEQRAELQSRAQTVGLHSASVDAVVPAT